MINKIQINAAIILGRMAEGALTDEDMAVTYAMILEEALDTLRLDGYFGPKGENDPRGDFRDGDWDMNTIQAYT